MKPKIKNHLDAIHQQTQETQPFNHSNVAKRLAKLLEYDVGLFFSNLSKLNDSHLGGVMLELPPEAFAAVLGRVTPHKLAAAVQALESDDATDLIQHIQRVDENLTHKILQLIHPQDRSDIVELSKYTHDQVGAYMEREFLSAYTDDTVATVKELVRNFRKNEPTTSIIKLFVLNHEDVLVGSIHFSNMILFDDNATMSEIMEELGYKPPLSIRPVSPITEVVKLFEEYDLNVIAVVNKAGKLIGRIVYDDIYDMIRQIEMNQAYALAGVNDEAEEGSFMLAAKQRLVWLLVNLATILLASLVIDEFSQTIATYIALAALLPIIAALGGNAGMQALTVTIRKLALNEVEYDDVAAILKREALIVFINGTVIAMVASIVVYMWFGDLMLGIILAAAIFLNLFIAGIAGALIPLGLTKLGIDPAIASSVFLTTTTDVFGFFIFLFLAEVFLL
jgi:magnesium transporter